MSHAYLLSWTEHERGWGQRPDGYSLHESPEECQRYLKEFYAARAPGPVPDEHESPDGTTPMKVIVQDSVALTLEAKKSVRLGRGALSVTGDPGQERGVKMNPKILAQMEAEILESHASRGAPAAPKRSL